MPEPTPAPFSRAIPTTSSAAYLMAIVLLTLGAVTGVVLVVVLRPEKDNAMVIVAILGVLTTTIPALIAAMNSARAIAVAEDTHKSVNGRLDKFLLTAEAAAHAEGKAEGMIEGEQKADARTDALRDAAPTTTQKKT